MADLTVTVRRNQIYADALPAFAASSSGKRVIIGAVAFSMPLKRRDPPDLTCLTWVPKSVFIRG